MDEIIMGKIISYYKTLILIVCLTHTVCCLVLQV